MLTITHQSRRPMAAGRATVSLQAGDEPGQGMQLSPIFGPIDDEAR